MAGCLHTKVFGVQAHAAEQGGAAWPALPPPAPCVRTPIRPLPPSERTGSWAWAMMKQKELGARKWRGALRQRISGESHRPPTPILLKSVAIHLPFLLRYSCKSMPSSWQKVVTKYTHHQFSYHDTAPICIAMLIRVTDSRVVVTLPSACAALFPFKGHFRLPSNKEKGHLCTVLFRASLKLALGKGKRAVQARCRKVPLYKPHFTGFQGWKEAGDMLALLARRGRDIYRERGRGERVSYWQQLSCNQAVSMELRLQKSGEHS